jgi:hypothetical protein
MNRSPQKIQPDIRRENGRDLNRFPHLPKTINVYNNSDGAYFRTHRISCPPSIDGTAVAQGEGKRSAPTEVPLRIINELTPKMSQSNDLSSNVFRTSLERLASCFSCP